MHFVKHLQLFYHKFILKCKVLRIKMCKSPVKGLLASLQHYVVSGVMQSSTHTCGFHVHLNTQAKYRKYDN